MITKEKQRELIIEIMKADEHSGIYDEPRIKQTAIQQSISMVRKRIESMNDTLMGKHTAHYLQQVERELYDLLEEEKQQIIEAHGKQLKKTQTAGNYEYYLTGEKYYKETYGKDA